MNLAWYQYSARAIVGPEASTMVDWGVLRVFHDQRRYAAESCLR